MNRERAIYDYWEQFHFPQTEAVRLKAKRPYTDVAGTRCSARIVFKNAQMLILENKHIQLDAIIRDLQCHMVVKIKFERTVNLEKRTL